MWKDAYLQSRIMAADRLELVAILYEYGIRALEDARGFLAEGNIELRARSINKAIAIVGELHGSLDYAAGGEIAGRLASLYSYMATRLSTANLKQEDAPLAEVENLLRTLGEAWKTISRPNEPAPLSDSPVGGYDLAATNLPFAMQETIQGIAGGWQG